ncbi:MAG: hypothetical protein KDI61_08340 [Alphaproteobacteria bacterium]|nr:hypothetical protein [Alphaproteobacteria bacterium]MCB1840252.1 hypothetical protein [Alphaproteobacteria bacterium]
MSEHAPGHNGVAYPRLNGAAALAFLGPKDEPKFKIKKPKSETETKVQMPSAHFESNEQAENFMQILVGSDALLGPEVTTSHKLRAILDTNDLDIMNEVGGFLTLTYDGDGKTSQRFKTRIPAEEQDDLEEISAEEADLEDDDPEETDPESEEDLDYSLVRTERKSEIAGLVSRPVFKAIKSDKLRGQLKALGKDIRVQGMMDYTSHETAIVVEGVKINVSLDRVTIHSRFDDVEPITFAEMEFDTHQKGKKARRVVHELAEKVRSAFSDQGAKISDTPKEERLLTNEDFLGSLRADRKAATKQAAKRAPAEDEAFIKSFLRDWLAEHSPTVEADFAEIPPPS